MIEVLLPLPPSVNRLWRTSKGGIMYRSDEYMQWRKVAMWEAAAQAKGARIEGLFKVTLRVARPDRRRRDLDNLLKAVLDAVDQAGLVRDDADCDWIDARWTKGGPECYVLLEDLEEEDASK
jgi:crossover junction endodeoxyribonuclease RusA